MQATARALTSISTSYIVNLLIINALLLVVGMFLDGVAAMIMMVPILMPLVKELGIDPIHFCLIFTMNLAIGQQTPPVASVLLTACAVSGVPIERIVGAIKYLLIVMFIVLMLVCYIPQLSLFLSDLLM